MSDEIKVGDRVHSAVSNQEYDVVARYKQWVVLDNEAGPLAPWLQHVDTLTCIVPVRKPGDVVKAKSYSRSFVGVLKVERGWLVMDVFDPLRIANVVYFVRDEDISDE